MSLSHKVLEKHPSCSQVEQERLLLSRCVSPGRNGKNNKSSNNNDGGGGPSRVIKDNVLHSKCEVKRLMSAWTWRPGLVLLLMLTGAQVSQECPPTCECIWKSGKESAVCSSLNHIPQGLDPGTQVLNMSGNVIRALPANVFLSLDLLNLQKIFLLNCQLTSIDKYTFAKLTNLVELELSENRMEFIPSHSFHAVPELRELKMNSNPISRISNDAFSSLPRLVRLELASCRLATIEIWAFRGLPALQWLRLDQNRLFTVQAVSFFPLRSLHGLELAGNPWNCSCALQPLRDWMMKNNVPYGVPPVCSRPRRLESKPWNELQLEDFACVPKLDRLSTDASSHSVKKVVEGENATLICRLRATPDTHVRWMSGNKAVLMTKKSGTYKNSGYIMTESFEWDESEKSLNQGLSSAWDGGRRGHKGERSLGVKISELTIIKATSRDAGMYTCRAESRAGAISANFSLIVLHQNKTDSMTGPLLMFGAVITILLTLIVCLLLVCLIFGGGSCKKLLIPQNTRLPDEKIELNHMDSHGLIGQNGGSSVPIMSPSNHHGNSNNVLPNNSTVNNNNSNVRRSSPKNSYKVLPTRDPDSEDSEVDESSAMIGEKKKGPDNCGRLGSNLSEEREKTVAASSSSTNVVANAVLNTGSRPVRKAPPPPPPQKPKTKYPDVIGGTEKFPDNSSYASLPHPYRNRQYDRGRTGNYFHRRQTSDSQSPLLPSSYGNSTDKISASGFSILSSSSSNTESYYRKPYLNSNPFASSYYDPYQRYNYNNYGPVAAAPTEPAGAVLMTPSTSIGANGKYSHHRLSMPTSPVHEYPGYSQYRQKGYERRAVRSSSGSEIHETEDQSNIYDYHAAQLSAFLEEYRVLQSELMRMRASLNNVDTGGGDKQRNDNDLAVDGENNSGVPPGDEGEGGKDGGGEEEEPQLKSILKNASPTTTSNCANQQINNNFSVV